MDFSGNHLLNFFSYNEVIHLYKMDDFMEKAKTVVFEIFKDKVVGFPTLMEIVE